MVARPLRSPPPPCWQARARSHTPRSRVRLRHTATSHRARRVHARRVLIHSQRHVYERDERSGEMRVGDLVTSLAAFWLSDDDPAIAKARQVIRHVRTSEYQIAREDGRIAGPFEQGHQDPGARRIGHRPAKPVHYIDTGSNSQHTLNYTVTGDQSPKLERGLGEASSVVRWTGVPHARAILGSRLTQRRCRPPCFPLPRLGCDLHGVPWPSGACRRGRGHSSLRRSYRGAELWRRCRLA